MKEAFSKRRKSIWLNKKMENHVRFIAILFFVGMALIISFGYRTFVSWITISKIFFGIAVLTSLIPIKFFPVLYRIKKELKILFTICALAPTLTGIILFTNFSITTESTHEVYKIKSTKRYPNDYMFIVNLEDNELEDYRRLRTFSSDDFPFSPDSAHYIVEKGIFRMPVIREMYLTP